MGIVYSAEDDLLQRTVALKFLPPELGSDAEANERFIHEAQAASALDHPNICTIHEIGRTDDGQLFICMAFYEGETLKKKIERGPFPVPEALDVVRQVAHGLVRAHERGIIHRDIKPHNILVTEDLTPKITDWGMSKLLATDPRKSSIAGFSLSYAAPEQVSPADYGRTTDVRTDIYQLGVVFYELVTGSIPFGGESIVSVGNAILKETALKPSEYNPDAAAVDRIIMKCLEKDPGLRYQSAEELLRALAGYLDEDEP